jgi:hypothetical protein
MSGLKPGPISGARARAKNEGLRRKCKRDSGEFDECSSYGDFEEAGFV